MNHFNRLRPPVGLDRSRQQEFASEQSGYGAEAPAEDAGAGWAAEYLRLIRKHFVKILLAAVAGCLLGTGYMLRQPVLYRASATIEITGINESFMNLNASDPQAGTGSYSNSVINIQTQMKLLQSPSLLARVQEKLNAESVPLGPRRPSRLDTLRRFVGVTAKEPVQAMQEALTMAARTISAQPVAGTRLIEISCSATSPDIAAWFANSLASEYSEHTMQNRMKNLQKTSQWLSAQVEQTRVKLEDAESKLQAFARSSGTAILQSQDTLPESKLRQLQTELSDFQADRIARQSKYQTTLNASPEAQLDSLQDSALDGYRTELTGLRRQLADLSATLAPEHYKVKRVQAQIAVLQRAITNQRDHVVAQLKGDYDSALKRESLLSAAYANQTRSVIGQADRTTGMAKLKRDVDLAHSAHNTMLQQLSQVGIASIVPTNNVRLVDASQPPGEPSQPNPLVLPGWGAVTGMAGAFLTALLLESSRKSINGPGQAPRLLQMRELGVIPSTQSDLSDNLRQRILRRGGILNRLVSGAGGNPATRTALIEWSDKRSFAAESFRTTLASILAENLTSQQGQVILLTSPSEGDGKTTVSCNLAMAVSETGRRAVILDGDLRRPRLNRIFGIEGKWGLSTLLDASKPIAEYELDELAIESKPGGPFVIPSGPSPANIAKTLHGARVAELIGRLRAEFDFVLIDSPPALVFSDARLLAQYCDQAILVVRSGKTNIKGLLAARQLFANDGTPFLGTILNDWDLKSGTDGSYNSYYDSYRKYVGTPD